MNPRFFLSYARADDDAVGGRRPIREFYDDLRKEVAQELGVGQRYEEVGFIDVEIPTAARWEISIREGLSRAEVLLCLVSPNFLASRDCGREWSLFERRMRDANAKHRILPVIWRKPKNRGLPEFIDAIQYSLVVRDDEHQRVAYERYNRHGLRTLVRDSDKTKYSVVIEGIAQRVIELGNEPLEPLGDLELSAFRTLVPRFPVSEAAKDRTLSEPRPSRARKGRNKGNRGHGEAEELSDSEVEVTAEEGGITETWTVGELGELTVSDVKGDPDVVEAVGEAVGLTPKGVRRRLNSAHGRTLVRNLFEDRWPVEDADEEHWEQDELGGQTVASVRADESAVEAISVATGRSRRGVRKVLAEHDGRYRVRTVFAESWPEADEDDDDRESADYSPDELGELRAASTRDDDALVDAISSHTGISRRWVRRKLNAANGRTMVRTVFAGYWEDGSGEDDSSHEWTLEELGELTSAVARRDPTIVEAIEAKISLSARWVRRRLNAASGRALVRNALSDHWPEELDRELVEALGSKTCASAQRDEVTIDELSYLLELSPRKIRRVLRLAGGRTLVKNAFAGHWP